MPYILSITAKKKETKNMQASIQPAKSLSVFRSERKYLVNYQDRMRLISNLDKLLIPDAYGDYNGYKVKSVYCDGSDNQDYIEKRSKFNFVKRICLRIYHRDDPVAKFEIKRKTQQNQIKETVIVTRADAKEMLQGNFAVLKNYEGPTAELGYEVCASMGYRPISLVDYSRRAYTHPQFNTRITLDSELSYSNFAYDMFNEHATQRQVLPLNYSILEVKYETYLLPQIQAVLKACHLKPCPISKFGSSRALLEEFYY